MLFLLVFFFGGVGGNGTSNWKWIHGVKKGGWRIRRLGTELSVKLPSEKAALN